jgi:hypothetical protein
LALDWEEGATIRQYTHIYFGDERTRSGSASVISLFNSHMPRVVQTMNHLKCCAITEFFFFNRNGNESSHCLHHWSSKARIARRTDCYLSHTSIFW